MFFFQIRKPKKVEADHDDSTDSECELDYDISDEISVEAQEQIAKYLTEKHGYCPCPILQILS